MSGCEMEMCRNWTGDGCACAVLGLDPDVVDAERLGDLPRPRVNPVLGAEPTSEETQK